MSRSAIVIGAGVAGLSTGCYAQMNGYSTRIVEMHDKPGGLCTAWQRRGYTVDVCIHWLVGSKPCTEFHKCWQEIGLVQGREFLDLDEFVRVEGADGRTAIFYTDLVKLERHLLELSPEDAPAIKELLGDARRVAKRDMPAGAPVGLAGMLRVMPHMIPFLRPMRKWGKLSIADFCARLKDPLLKEAFAKIRFPDMSALILVFTLAWFHAGNAGYPIGGSLPMVRAVEKRFRDLGGEIEYKSRVTSILVEDGRAVGVRLEDGKEERADTVISAADGHATIFDMLGGRYLDDTIRGYYEIFTPFPPLVFIGLGVARDFTAEPKMVSGGHLHLAEPAQVGPTRVEAVDYRVHNFDPTLAPAGKTVITASIATEYQYWKELVADRAGYEAQKRAAADLLITALDRRYPGLAGQVEMIDVSTPVTFERYTGNWKGSFEGWLPTPASGSYLTGLRNTLPGLANFYMVGQWVAPGGGLPSGVITGRQVVQLMCKRDKKRFLTTV